MNKIRLDDIDKKVPFEVPENYFDQLTSQIQDRVKEKPKRQWLPYGQVRWAVAGAFSLVLVALIIFYPEDNALSVDQMLAEVSDEDLMEYLDFSEVSDFELVEGIESSELDGVLGTDTLGDLDFEENDLNDLLNEYELDNLL